MTREYCVKVTCTNTEIVKVRYGHKASFYPRYYVETDWNGKTVARWTEIAKDATALTEDEANIALSKLRSDGYESEGELLVVAKLADDITAQHDELERRKGRYQILVFTGSHGFGMDYIYANDLDDLKAKARKQGIDQCALYNWDKIDSSGNIAGSFKAVDKLDQDDWDWLTTQPQYDRHMLIPN